MPIVSTSTVVAAPLGRVAPALEHGPVCRVGGRRRRGNAHRRPISSGISLGLRHST